MCADIRPALRYCVSGNLSLHVSCLTLHLSVVPIVFLSDTPREPGPILAHYCDSNYCPLLIRLVPTLFPGSDDNA